MFKVYLALGLALVIVGLSVVVQNEDLSTYRVWSAVDSLRIAPADAAANQSGAWQLWVKGSHGDACALEMQSEIARFPHNIDIQLYREIPSTANCAGDEAFFERRLALSDAILDEQPPYLIINDQVWSIAYATDEAESAPELQALALMPAHVEQAALLAGADAADQYDLRIRGRLAGGCDLPALYSLRAATESVFLGVFNAVEAETACPDLLATFAEEVPLPATNALADSLLLVNAIPIHELERPEMSLIDKVLTNILAVTVQIEKADAVRVSLDVKGEQPDGCDLPVLVKQARQAKTVTVEVYREVPVDMFCPMILQPYQDRIQLAGDFAPGKYIINVNTYTQALEIE